MADAAGGFRRRFSDGLRFGAISAVALGATIGPSEAQTTSPPVQLPPVVVQGQAAPATPKVTPKAAPRAARQRRPAQAVAPAPPPAAPAATTAAATPSPETGTSPVQGVVARISATGTKTDTPLIATPQAISVVTRDQFEQQGAQSIGQALQYTSGVAADTRTAFGGYDIIYSRGFAVDRFLDGLRYPGGRDFTAPQIELYGLERLEVLRGPASMLYGASSPGGIVNAISKRPLDTPLHEVELVSR